METDDTSSPRRQRRNVFFAVALILVVVLVVTETGSFQALVSEYSGRSIQEKQSCFTPSNSKNESSSTNATTTASTTASLLPPSRHQVGTWVSNIWIPPPPWRYHTPTELNQLYRNKRILWIGDSTGRRSSMTLYALIEWSRPDSNHSKLFLHDELASGKLIDVSKGGVLECDKWINETHQPEICRPMNDGAGEMIYISAACYDAVLNFFQIELAGNESIAQDVDLVVITAGVWEVVRPQKCQKRRTNEEQAQVVNDVFQIANQFQQERGVPVVWRTSGYTDHGPYFHSRETRLIKDTMDRIDRIQRDNARNGQSNRLTYVNWGGALKTRSRPGERIAGDVKAHYDVEPRLVLIEMLTNHLEERGFFDS